MIIRDLIVELAKHATDELTPYPFNAILSYLIDQVTAQEEDIKRIERTLEAHILSPFRTGLLYLEEAKNASSEVRQRDFLNKASDAFLSVSHLDLPHIPLIPVQAQFYVGVCYTLLNEGKNALRWYYRAYQSAVKRQKDLNSSKHSIGTLMNSRTNKKQIALKTPSQTRYELDSFIESLFTLIHSLDPNIELDTFIKDQFNLIGHSSMVKCLAFSPNSVLLASGSVDHTIRLWDMKSGKEFRCLKTANSVNSVAFSPDGSLLASGTDGNAATLWDVNTGRVTQSLTGHSGQVTCVAFIPNGSLLASGAWWYDPIQAWEIQSGQKVRVLTESLRFVSSIAFSPDGSLLASSDVDTVTLWDVKSSKIVRNLATFSSKVKSVTFSPDGLLLAGGAENDTVFLWDITSGEVTQRLTGHSSSVASVAFSPDGSFLASGSLDSTVRLWKVASGQEYERLHHLSGVVSIAFSSDGLLLASGTMDSAIKVWSLWNRTRVTVALPQQT